MIFLRIPVYEFIIKIPTYPFLLKYSDTCTFRINNQNFRWYVKDHKNTSFKEKLSSHWISCQMDMTIAGRFCFIICLLPLTLICDFSLFWEDIQDSVFYNFSCSWTEHESEFQWHFVSMSISVVILTFFFRFPRFDVKECFLDGYAIRYLTIWFMCVSVSIYAF